MKGFEHITLLSTQICETIYNHFKIQIYNKEMAILYFFTFPRKKNTCSIFGFKNKVRVHSTLVSL